MREILHRPLSVIFWKSDMNSAHENCTVWLCFFGRDEHTGRVWCLLYPITGISKPSSRQSRCPTTPPGCTQTMLCQRLYRNVNFRWYEQDVRWLSGSPSNLCKYQACKTKAWEGCYSRCCCGSQCQWARFWNVPFWPRPSAHYLGNCWWAGELFNSIHSTGS